MFILYGDGERGLSINRLGLWLLGGIIVDRACKKSRRKSLDKIKRILDKGGNVLIFPEGSFNNSPNFLVKKMRWGLLEAATQTGANIVPVAEDKVGKECRVTIGEIFDYSQYPTKHEQLAALRDKMATLTWELIEMNPVIKREDISIDYWLNRINYNYENVQTAVEYDEGSEFKPKDEISLGEVLADLYGIEYKSMAVDYEQYRRIERLIENWTKPINFRDYK